MLTKKIQFWRSLLFLCDGLLLCGSWWLAYRIRFLSGWIPMDFEVPPWATYQVVLWLIPVLWLFFFAGFKLSQTRRRGSRVGEVFRLARATGLFTLVLVSASWLLFKGNYSRIFLGTFWLSSTVYLLVLRVGFRELIRALRRRGWTSRNALVVGTDELARLIQEKFRMHPELGLHLVGYATHTADEVGDEIDSVPVVGTIHELTAIVRVEQIDEVFVVQSSPIDPHLDEILRQLEDDLVDVNLISDLCKHALLGARIEDFDGLPLLAVSSSPMIGWGYVLKRVFDVTLATLGLIVTGPLILLAALLVRLTSPGPVFYRQERFGLDGRCFIIHKIRTMVADAEKDGPVWGVPHDPRVTRVGRWMRWLSIDELPQLWNVIVGDMSLVGPRPAQPIFVERFKESIPRYMLRHRVKPGLTGWAQINGQRGDAPPDERLQYDLFYIRNWSVVLDCKIIWRTVFGGFLNRNA